MVWVHDPLTEPSMLISLPVKSMSSVDVKYWVTPCSLATLPVLTICWVVGHKLTLLPELLIATFGEAAPLVILLSENPWETCAMAGAAVSTTTASIATTIKSLLLNFCTSLLLINKGGVISPTVLRNA